MHSMAERTTANESCYRSLASFPGPLPLATLRVSFDPRGIRRPMPRGSKVTRNFAGGRGPGNEANRSQPMTLM